MAIYRQGTAAMSAAGTITGANTQWMGSLNLIRVGATFVFLTNPIKICTISQIVSNTELRATNTDGAAVPAGTPYVILLSDSLTVDGLAQDIAETLKYYQASEQRVQANINQLASSLGALSSKSTIDLNTPDASGVLPVTKGGTGAGDAAGARSNLGLAYGATAGTVAQGDDYRLNTINGKTGGTLPSTVYVKGPSPAVTPANGTETSAPLFDSGFSSGIYNQVHVAFHATVVQGSGSKAVIAIQTSGVGAYTRYLFDQSGNATAPGSWVPTSDVRLKTNIKRIEDPLSKMRKLQGCTWTRIDTGRPGIGFLAQEVNAIFPDVVTKGQDVTLADGTVIKDVLSPDTYGVAAALHHESILALMNEVEELKRIIADKLN